MTVYQIRVTAMAIVNHTLESGGVPVETRQRINDECDLFAIEQITKLVTPAAPEKGS